MKITKKILSFVLAAAIVLFCLPVSFAAESELRFTVASDLHFESTERVGDLRNDEDYSENDAYYDATTQGQMSSISEAILRSFLEDFLYSGSPVLLLPGDLTNGNTVDHIKLASILQSVLDRSADMGIDKKIYLINGNHDIDDDNSSKFISAESFKSCYNNFGYSNALEIDKNSCSYTADLDENYRLISIDSCVYGQDQGELSAERINWILKQAEAAKSDGKTLVAMMHHSILAHFSVQDTMTDYMDYAELFADTGIHYVFTGHMHGNDIAEAVTNNGNKLYDIMTGSLITTPCAYRNVSLTADKMTVNAGYVTKIDAQYLPTGLNDLQYELITTDFSGYAKGFFNEGMSRWLMKFVGSAKVLAKSLSIEEGTREYAAIDYVLGCAGDALSLPVYNSEASPGKYDSIEELAAVYGFTLPQSQYSSAGEIVGAVMSSFFAGDESIKYTDPEIQLLFSIVSTGLTYAVLELTQNGEHTQLVDAFFDAVNIRTRALNITKIGAALAGKQAANVLLSAILVPIIEGVSNDEYSPSDLNTVLEGPNTLSSQTVSPSPLSNIQKVINYFKRFFSVIKEYLSAFFAF